MKLVYSIILMLLVSGVFVADRNLIVTNDVRRLTAADSMNFESTRRMFGNQKLKNKNDFISIYRMPAFGKKICYTIIYGNGNLDVTRKEIVSEEVSWNGRNANDSSENGVLSTPIAYSNQTSLLCSPLKDATKKILKSERRVHAISRRRVIFPDEDIWFLEIQRGGKLDWAKWYSGSKKWQYIENAFSKLENLK